MELQIHCSHAYRTLDEDFEVMEIRFEGKYDSGSLGNKQARAMMDDIFKILSKHSSIGIILDLRELEYRWGNTIGSTIRSIDSKKHPCVVLISVKSSGLDDDFMRSISGKEFYYNEPDAIVALKEKMNKKA